MSHLDVKQQNLRVLRIRTSRWSAPGRLTDHSAEVATAEAGILVCEYIRFHVSESSLRIMLDAVVEGLQNVLFEMGCARVRLSDRDAVGVSEAAVVDSEYIHF